MKSLFYNASKRVNISLLMCVILFFGVLNAATSQSTKYRIPVIKTSDDFANKVYIDPSAPEGGNGTIASPFNAWSDVTVNSNTAYLLKAGTTMEGSISGNFINCYVGAYGEGTPPIIRGIGIGAASDDFTVNGLQVIREGFTWQMIALSEENGGPSNVTIANCLIKGLDTGNGYPHRNIQGRCTGLTLYHNEVCYSKDDGMYLAGSNLNTVIVSNYFHHNNMGGVVATTSAGDGIQFESVDGTGTYIANNYIDRKESNWKFALIFNSTLAKSSNVVCEWNTFVAPKNSSAGGTAVRWLGGTDNTYRKNLINSWSGLTGIATYDAHANQAEPYGIRDNHEFGPGAHCNTCDSEDNLDFPTENEYLAYLDANQIEKYGCDFDINNFWNGVEVGNDPCTTTNIEMSATVVDDQNSEGTGSITTNVSGGTGTLDYSWSNGETTQDISNLMQGSYTLTVVDENSCSKSNTFTVNNQVVIEPIKLKGKKLKVVKVAAEDNDGNSEDNMIDSNLTTRWSSDIYSVSSTFTLDSISAVDYVRIATYKGDQRNTYIDIYTSENGEDWSMVYDCTTSGTTSELETFPIQTSTAKYIKLIGFGNNLVGSEAWTSITEFEAWGEILKTSDVENNVMEKTEIYPNPIGESFTVNVNENAQMEIVTMSGASIYNAQLKSGSNSFTNDFLNTGIYLMKLTSEETAQTATKKLVVK